MVTYVIGPACADTLDRTCIDTCPVDCIYEGDRALYIHPDECIDCGACEPVCPVDAIMYDEDLPAELAAWPQVAKEFFGGQSPGGANGGRTGVDHPAVAALPKKF
jgi:NAD-dependent dihydropyrimidine dehydrogenase PreA subunit